MPVTTKLLPSADARMAVDALNSVLAAELGDSPLADRIAAAPDAGLWSALSDGGWHLIGADSGPAAPTSTCSTSPPSPSSAAGG